MTMRGFVDEINLAEGFLPVNMASGANDGDWVSLKNYQRVAIIFYGAPGAAGEPATITVEQATDVSGGNAKALTFTRYAIKTAATNLQAVGTWTRSTQTAANTLALGSGANGDKAAIVVIEFQSEDLDVDGGFDCIRATIADVGLTSQIGAVLYALMNPRFTPVPSALTN
jgi:hypothetical protein